MTDVRPADDGVAAGVTVAYRVRFDEAGPDGAVRTSAVLRYAQDCAWVHSAALGFDREWYRARGLTWVVRSIELSIGGRVATGERLDISTAVTGFRRVWARRRTRVCDAAGALVASVDTDWVMTDTVRGAPTRVPADFPLSFGVLVGTFEPHRVVLPPAPASATRLTFGVRPQELDPLGHANNAAYLDWLEEAASASPDGAGTVTAVPRTYRLEYLGPARPGLLLTGEAWATTPAGGIAYRLLGAEGELFRGTVVRDPMPDGQVAGG